MQGNCLKPSLHWIALLKSPPLPRFYYFQLTFGCAAGLARFCLVGGPVEAAALYLSLAISLDCVPVILAGERPTLSFLSDLIGWAPSYCCSIAAKVCEVRGLLPNFELVTFVVVGSASYPH
jgi:hypothetical protein